MNYNSNNKSSIRWLVLLLAIFPSILFSEEYISFESKHFHFAIDSSKSHNIEHLASICEKSYNKLSKIFDLKFKEKTRIIFIDKNDIANGYAIGFKNWVGIYLPPADFLLRGSHNWLKNVIAHEMSHIFTLRKLGFTSSFLGVSVGANSIINHKNSPIPLSETLLSFTYLRNHTESWLAEGIAQLGAELAGYERWDSHRAMHERIRYTSGAMIPLEHLKVFSEDSRHSEGIYNQGYSFWRFIYSKVNSKGLQNILSEGNNSTLKTAIEIETKKNFELLFQEWLQHLETLYSKRENQYHVYNSLTSIPSNIPYIVEKNPIKTSQGLYFLSSRENDHGATHLYYKSNSTLELLDRNITGALVLQDSLLYYIKQVMQPNNYLQNELYSINTKSQTIQKVLMAPPRIYAVQPCGDNVYIIARKNGNQIISSIKPNLESVFEAPLSIDLLSLSCNESQNKLLFTQIKEYGQDIMTLDLNTHKVTPLLATPFDERDPIVSNGELYFSANYTGIYQVYKQMSDSTVSSPLTKSFGGAFTPFINEDTLYFSNYTKMGYTLSSTIIDYKSIQYNDYVDARALFKTSLIDTIRRNDSLPPTMPKLSNKNANYFNYLGFGVSTVAIYNPTSLKDTIIGLGTKVGSGLNLIFSDPTMDNSVGLNGMIFTGPISISGSDISTIENYSGAIDHIISGQYTTTILSPTLNFSLHHATFTLDYPIEITDSLDADTSLLGQTINPRTTEFGMSAEAYYLISLNYQVALLFDYLKVSTGITGIETGTPVINDVSFTLGSMKNITLVNLFQEINSGTQFINSGFQLSLPLTLSSINQLVIDTLALPADSLDSDSTSYKSQTNYIFQLFPGATLYQNINRTIFFSEFLYGGFGLPLSENSTQQLTTQFQYGFTINTMLPQFSFGKKAVIKDGYITFSYGGLYTVTDQYQATAGLHSYSKRFINSPNQSSQNLIPSFLNDGRSYHTLGLFLTLKHLSLYNFISFWRVGCSVPINNFNIKDPTYILEFTF